MDREYTSKELMETEKIEDVRNIDEGEQIIQKNKDRIINGIDRNHTKSEIG